VVALRDDYSTNTVIDQECMNHKITILIVADDLHMGNSLSEVLRTQGYETLCVHKMSDGRLVPMERRVNVVLIDLTHPELVGKGTLDEVMDDYPNSEVIILAEHATLNLAIEATRKWAYAYILKPYEVHQLSLHVRHAVEKREAVVKLRQSEARLESLVEELKKELNLARETAEVCIREKNEFVAAIKKELSTRLNVITGCSFILLEGTGGELNENQRDFAGYILENGRALQNRIFYRPEFIDADRGGPKPGTNQEKGR
jgi:FixJ family two-component response regulator